LRAFRLNLAIRLTLAMCAVALVSMGIALLRHERSLAGDLEAAARTRIERGVEGAELLIANYLRGLQERYDTLSGTPQFRANLEAEDAATLHFFAGGLAAREGAVALAFLDEAGAPLAAAGDAAIADAARGAFAGGLPELGGAKTAAQLLASDDRLLGSVLVPLEARGQTVGYLLAVEAVAAEHFREWSQLTGFELTLVPAGPSPADHIETTLAEFPAAELRVVGSLSPEREALRNARRELLAAGSAALLFALGASLLLATTLVRPIEAIRRSVERIAAGDFSEPVALERSDEIGDVARAVHTMVRRLKRYRSRSEQSLTALRASQSRLARAQHLARLGSWECELETRASTGSPEFRRIYGIAGRGPLAFPQLIERIHPEDREEFVSALERCLMGEGPLRLDHRIQLPDGRERIVSSHGELIDQAAGLLFEGTVQDITDRKRVEEQVRTLSYYDSLTGLPNRALFLERLHLAVARAKREQHRIATLSLDLDRFKRINDTMGHSKGDRVLEEVAHRVVRSVHEANLAGRRHGELGEPSVARLGGDEFGVVLEGIRAPEDAARIARRILAALSQSFVLDGQEVVVGASVGIAVFPEDGPDAEHMLRNCDAAMFAAKDQGRDNYQFYTRGMHEAAFRRLIVENRLRGAIQNEELELHYQPKMRPRDGGLMGFEALLRWDDPELGTVSPHDFVPIAEESGLIEAVGEWALRTAAHQIRAWSDAGLDPFYVAVNVSGRQVEGGRLRSVVAAILEETGVTPDRIELEITESVLMESTSDAEATLQELRELGLRLSLDDFGTGFSSLQYLKTLPFDALKIDRSFVRGLEADPQDAGLVGAIVSMGKTLGYHVVAEGVESEEQCEILRELGCDEVQGYYVGEAVPAEEAQAMLERRRSRRAVFGRKRRRDPAA